MPADFDTEEKTQPLVFVYADAVAAWRKQLEADAKALRRVEPTLAVGTRDLTEQCCVAAQEANQ